MKQEPKQRLEKYSERFNNDKSPIGNPETWGKRVLTEEDIFNQRDIDAVTDYINRETSKQETLEEAYNKIYKSIDFTEFDFASFAIGVKHQQERSYSEEELYSEIEWLIISWNNDGTKTAGHLTRQIIEQLKKK